MFVVAGDIAAATDAHKTAHRSALAFFLGVHPTAVQLSYSPQEQGSLQISVTVESEALESLIGMQRRLTETDIVRHPRSNPGAGGGRRPLVVVYALMRTVDQNW